MSTNVCLCVFKGENCELNSRLSLSYTCLCRFNHCNLQLHTRKYNKKSNVNVIIVGPVRLHETNTIY